MTFNLNLYGDSPAELRALINALADLPGGLTIEHTPSAPHPAQPQSEAVAQPDESKVPAPAKPKKDAQKPAAAPAEAQANPNAAEAPASPAQADTAPASSTTSPEPKADPAVLDKIRDLARSLIVQGKRDGVQRAIKSAGAAAISKLPPESYTAVWEQLLKLKDEVDADAAG
jgi:hypothetical protein